MRVRKNTAAELFLRRKFLKKRQFRPPKMLLLQIFKFCIAAERERETEKILRGIRRIIGFLFYIVQKFFNYS